MKTSTVLVFLVLVVLAAGAVYLGGDSSATSPSGETGGPLLGDLISRVNDVDRLVVRDVDGDVTLTRSDDGERWHVDELHGYPADFEVVKAAIVGAARLEALERKTARREHFERLGVQDVDLARTAKELGTLDSAVTGPVELELSAGGEVLATLVLGTRGAGRDQRYARVVGGESSWLVKGALDVPGDAKGWVSAEIADVAATRLARVTTVHADGEIIETTRSDEETTDWQVADVPEGFELVYEGAGRQPANGVAALRFEDVRPGGVDDLAPEEHATTTYTTFDGLTITITSAPKPRPADATGDETPSKPIEVVVRATAADDASDEVAAEAAAITAAADGWVFAVPTWKGDAMRKHMADLVTPVAAPEPEPTVEPAAESPAEADAPPADTIPDDGAEAASDTPADGDGADDETPSEDGSMS